MRLRDNSVKSLAKYRVGGRLPGSSLNTQVCLRVAQQVVFKQTVGKNVSHSTPPLGSQPAGEPGQIGEFR
jgi:hypothetical protein